MASKLLYSAESWDVVYRAFEQVNFTAYDYDAVKQSLLDYLKLNYPENFNDYIESSQLIALIEAFAYIAEQISYRVDMSTHESTISTAQRKQMILRQAKLLSYSASRNIPLRGLVKVVAVSCSEDLTDAQGNILTNKTVRWADSANFLWRDQFALIMGRLLTRPQGSPLKVARVNDVVFQQHALRNLLETDASGTSFINGVLPYNVDVNGSSLKFELVPADVDDGGVFERSPDPSANFNVLYADDGFGETSPLTGFMLYTKQGALNKLLYVFDYKLPNSSINVTINNINDVDVWLHEVTEGGVLIDEWEQIDNVNGENLYFNTSVNFKKFELETLENDQIRLLFGDGDFAEIPKGIFNIWVRSSDAGNATVPVDALTNQSFTFAYMSAQGRRETCTLTCTLSSALQNGAASEDIEHIRAVAPAIFRTQDRMVNGEDYNNYPLKDSTILHLKTVNRTFAGQPKYVPWNDASGAYQTVKMFGDDGRLYFDISASVTTTKSSARNLIDEVLEPMLANPGIYNLLTYSFYTAGSPQNKAYVRPRVKFIESANQGTFEKTMVQGALDRHWYGEPDSTVYLGPDLTTGTTPLQYYGVITSDADGRIYDSNLLMVTLTNGVYAIAPTATGASGIQDSVMRQRRFGIGYSPKSRFLSSLIINDGTVAALGTSDLLTTAAVGALAVVETLTIEVINEEGELTVTGTVSGLHQNGHISEVYNDGYISFLVDFPAPLGGACTPGDAFIIDLVSNSGRLTPALYKVNLEGSFSIISELDLPLNAESIRYDPLDPVASWVFIIERNDDVTGSLDFWRITARNFKLVLGSPTTNFFFDSSSYIVDIDTKTRVRDNVKVLKSNLNAAGEPLSTDQKFYVSDVLRYPDGELNPYGLLVAPSTVNIEADAVERAASAYNFLTLVGAAGAYVYFTQDPTTGRLTMIEPTVYIQNLTYQNNTAGIYVRKQGRSPLDYSWTHYVGDNLTDPSPSNIHDMYVLTRGHYTAMAAYLAGLGPNPTPPTPFELRTSYRSTLQKKMMSDQVVLRPAKLKLLFGDKAAPELRAKLKLIKADGSRLSDDQLRTQVYNIINVYFSIDEWSFGKVFYAQELCAVVQSQLPVDVASAVLVPELPASSFGDLMQVTSQDDEIPISALELKDIIIITDLNRATLRQR